jgi:hypothetical protein
MSDAPERIWCLEPQTSAQDQRRVGTWGNWDIGRGTEYRRADLPPTLAQAKMVEEVRKLVEAVEALGAMPEGYCYCSRDRIGDHSKIHEPECADLRAALHRIGETNE